jgi:hypothetical protein
LSLNLIGGNDNNLYASGVLGSLNTTVSTANSNNIYIGADGGPEMLEVSDLLLGNNTNLNMDVDGSTPGEYDQITDITSMDLNSALLNINSSHSLADDENITLLDVATGFTSVIGTFENYTEGDSVPELGANAVFTYAGGAENADIQVFKEQTSTGPSPTMEFQNIYRIFSPERRAHAYISKAERDEVLATDPAWISDLNGDPAFQVVSYDSTTESCTDPNATPVYRYWSSKFERHFYTISEEEKSNVDENPDWDLYDGIKFCAYEREIADQAGFSGVYRFWDKIGGGHFYTASTYEYNKVIDEDPTWKYEQVGFAVPE